MQVEHNTLLPTHITDRKSNYQIPIAWIVDNGIEVTELHLSSFDKIDVHYNPKHSSEIITKNMHIGIMAFDKKLSNGNNSILQMYRNGIVNFPNQQINIHDSKLTWLNNSWRLVSIQLHEMGFFEYCKKYLKQVCQKQKLSTPETEIFFDSNIRLYGCKTQKEHLFSTHPNVRLNLWSFLQVEEELNMTIIHELGHCVYPLGHHKLFWDFLNRCVDNKIDFRKLDCSYNADEEKEDTIELKKALEIDMSHDGKSVPTPSDIELEEWNRLNYPQFYKDGKLKTK